MTQPKLDLQALLTHLPLFRNLDPEQLALMAGAAREARVQKNAYLFHRGDPAKGLFVVATGRIKLSLPSPRGQDKLIELFGPGQAFGEAVMFLDRPYPVDAQALEDSLLVWIDRKDIDVAVERDPSFARRMLAGLSLRLHSLVQDIETVNLQSATQRVIAYLLAQPREGGLLHLDLNKNLIASKLGLTPETFSRLLGQLGHDGLIEVDGPEIRLLDPEGLERRLFTT